MKKKVFAFPILGIMFYLFACSDSTISVTDSEPLDVLLRMEVHVVDSLYPIYSIPRTKTFLYTYKKRIDGGKSNEEYSDTTTCPNGWAVKELSLELEEGDTVFLGATIKNPPVGKYQFAQVSYDELLRFDEDADTITFVKTFTIYQ